MLLTDAGIVRAHNQAQLKKMVEWGEEVCTDKSHHPHYDCMYRHYCISCWKALLKEVG